MPSLQNAYLQNAFLHNAVHDPALFYSAFASHPETSKSLAKQINPQTQAAFSNILSHVTHIQQSGFEREVMSDLDATLLATFIEMVAKRAPYTGTELILASAHCPRHLLYSTATGKVTLVAHESLAQLFTHGGYKSVQSATTLDMRNPACSFQRAVATLPKQGCGALSKQEVENLILMQNTRGVVHIVNWKEIPGFGFLTILEGYQNDLTALFRAPRTFSEEQNIRLAKDLVLGLSELHRRGCAHCDIKGANALYRFDEEGEIEGAISDLGLSYILQNGQKRTPILATGYCAAVEHTAPEHFGIPGGKPEDDFKEDVFALGCTLFRLILQPDKQPPWSHLIREAYDHDYVHTNPEKLAQYRIEMQILIMQYVEVPYHKIASKAPETRTKHEQVCFVIYSLMRLYPERRIALDTAYDLLDALLTPDVCQLVAELVIANEEEPSGGSPV